MFGIPGAIRHYLAGRQFSVADEYGIPYGTVRVNYNISTALAGQRLGIKEVDDGFWLVSFMHYDLGYFDLEQETLQPLDNPFGPRLSPIS